MANKAVMAHIQAGDNHAVAAQMRVLISRTDVGHYVAQGLDLDYCATGHTIEEARDHFASGFLRTIEALLRNQRSLSALFKSRTPPEIWQEYMDSKSQDELTCFANIDLRDKLPKNIGFPFEELSFCSQRQLSFA